ncbi:zinc-binding dehydrogenase [Amycolatopsis australiensis]|uniref:zinc-binding dehydrogenase n=1 Tax=Amycolatopsis australiensis TaxID=546364 RepID=UPI000931DC42
MCTAPVGSILGRRVLVTGASGGVGRFAVQLAAAGGAEVIATTGDVAQRDGSHALGAHHVLGSPGELTEPVSAVLDMVGGRQLVSAHGRLARGGMLVAIGHAAREAEVFDLRRLLRRRTRP